MIDSAELKKAYRDMLLIRRLEEKIASVYTKGLIGGFCHLYIGQEAIVAALTSLMNPVDTAITSYRDHGHMVACGMSSGGIIAELMGKATGHSKGKGGSMHMFSTEKNFFGGHGVVGAQVSIGTGLAFAHKYKQDGGVCFTYFGDGASNQGQFFESMNMAALWKLPVLYIIENNGYSMGTSCLRGCANYTDGLFKRAEPFGIHTERVNGMDYVAIKETAKKMVDMIRNGEGPCLIECVTYRYRGHSMSDPAKYRSKEEVELMKGDDPIEKIKILLAEKFSSDDIKQIDIEIKDIVNKAVEFAQQSEFPEARELYTDVCL